jgi:hypothetical protein
MGKTKQPAAPPKPKPTGLELVRLTLNSARVRVEYKREQLKGMAAAFVRDLQGVIADIDGGRRRPVNTLGHFQGNAPRFDVMCAELGAAEDAVTELEEVLAWMEAHAAPLDFARDIATNYDHEGVTSGMCYPSCRVCKAEEAIRKATGETA